ncbi:MAG: sialate O-acetylesterase [Planctomycetaceae bacterium]|nr:sialate O-acetylesterase [Planctomycetales bacterium]MCB9922527.1 sialate O-acetylesterase [Planctomycetaceae bacterium]
MIFRRLILAVLLLLPFCDSAPADDGPTVALPPRENFHLYLLVGQSNMAGRGIVAEEDRQPHPRVLMFTKNRQWAPAVDPLHFDKPVAGVGIGRTFGIELAKANPDITIGLIPCAVGGSPISSWEPGGYHAQTKSHPYDDAIKRAKQALEVGVLKGILWHQGESDSHPGAAEVYEQKLHTLIARFREELNAPEAPFLAGQLGQFAERPWDESRKLVDAAHRSLPKKIAHTAFVSSDRLGHKGDEVHFNAAAYREFGRRYAEAFQKLTQSQ